MTKKIFITGGTGFFGKSILDFLNRSGSVFDDLTILSRDPQKFATSFPILSKFPSIHFVGGDIRNFHFPSGHFDAIIHAAAPVVENLKPGEIRDTILKGNERIIEFAKHCGTEKILLTSSGAVYGPQPPSLEKIPETFICNPVTEYGIAKLDAEHMLIASGIYSCIGRCFAFVGPYLPRNAHFAIGNFIRDCLAGQDIIIKGDGSPFRSYLYADDLVSWLFAVMENGENGRPYNIGSDEAISIYELACSVQKIIGSKNEIKVLSARIPGQPPMRYVPDVNRIKNELSVQMKFSLHDAINASI